MQMHKNIKTVLKKETGMSGKFRIRKVKVITGEKNFVTTYKENSCLFKLDISNMFYSTKLSTDRKRIAEQSGRNENILVPFAGYGPFAITIAKKNPKTKVVGIELNPEAVKYFEENIKLNKLNNCKALLGDASKIVEKYPEFKKWADRIIMPLPKNALDFLPYVLKCAKTGTILHIYAFDSKAGEYLNAQHLNAFDSKEYPFERKIKKVEIIAKKYGFKTKLLNKKLVRPYAPNVFQICLDIQII
jgi:tRNA (guanine37-N1)-methyltransferase